MPSRRRIVPARLLFAGILDCNFFRFDEKGNVSGPDAYVVDRMAVHPYACKFVPADIEAALGRRYIIGSEIAAGGQGAVFRATRTSQADGTATMTV